MIVKGFIQRHIYYIEFIIPCVVYFILFFTSSLTGFSQDISQETILLKRISELQVQKDSFYHAGMFPTLRTNARNTNIVKHDNNIFFTALVAFSLKQLRNNFTPAQQVICDTIVQRAYRAYPYFKHHSGRPSYNFWSTDHPVIFPNNRLLNLFNQSQALPDDIDDTSIVWLSQDAPDSVVAIIHDLMIKHTNATRKKYGIHLSCTKIYLLILLGLVIKCLLILIFQHYVMHCIFCMIGKFHLLNMIAPLLICCV